MNRTFPKEGLPIKEIAALIQARIVGSEDVRITSFCPLNEPVRGGLSFAKSAGSKELKKVLAEGRLQAIIVPAELDAAGGVTQLIAADPLEAMAKLSRHYLSPPRPEPGINKTSEIHPTAKIGQDVHIGAFVSIGQDAVIGDGAVIYPQVVIYQGAQIGKNSVIHAGAVIREYCKVGAACIVQNGAVIGADGFGYFFSSRKKLEAVPQVGTVELSDEVEVGANTCIDRATLGKTEVAPMAKIDNLAQIGHNTKIGQAAIICGNVGIAGSCEIGAGVTLGGGAGVADHVKIAPGVRVGGASGVTGHLTEKGDYVGFPAVKASDWRRQVKSLERLPKLIAKISRLLKSEGDV